MQIDAKMISNQTNNEHTELEVLIEHTQGQCRTEGTVHGIDSVKQQALHGCESKVTSATKR